MGKILYLIFIVAISGMGTSCVSTQNVGVKDLDGRWKVVSVNGEKVEKEELPYFEIDLSEKKLHGNAGCNIINSSILCDDENAAKLKFAQPISTLMACPYLELENQITKALVEVAAVKSGKKKGELTLVDKEGSELLLLDKNGSQQ